jgi:fructokinase
MILISGEALIDLIPDRAHPGRYDAALGGSPFNVAIGLARLGAPAAFVSRLSRDANGEALAAALGAAGVDLGFVARDARPSPLAFVTRGAGAAGERYSFYLDATAYDEAWPFPAVWPAGARHLHVGSFCAVDDAHGPSSAEALARARGHATTSFDPNIRPMVTPDRAAVLPLVEREVALASFVKASEEDLAWLYRDRDPEATIAHWATLGPGFCVMTRGEKGALAHLGAERLVAPSPKIDVVDTVGAGDSFMSALIGAMDVDGALGAGARAPTGADLGRWLGFAVAASAITCTRKGADPPTRAEVLAWIASRRA